MRYLSELSHKLSPPNIHQDKIKLQLPDPYAEEEKQPNTLLNGQAKMASEGVASPEWYVPLLAGLAGAPIGFLGSKAVYDHVQEARANKQIEDAKKQYTQQLMLAQQMNKQAETPILDSVCEALADGMEKDAGIGQYLGKGLAWLKGNPLLTGAGVGTGAVLGGNWLGERAGQEAAYQYPGLWHMPPPAVGDSRQAVMNVLPNLNPPSTDTDAVRNALDVESRVGENATKGLGRIANAATGGAAGLGKQLFMGLTGTAGLATLGLLIHNHNKKKEKEMKAMYPTGLQYGA